MAITDAHHVVPHDPLASIRKHSDPELDVFLTGTVFFDIIFIDLNEPPHSGTEVQAGGMGASPGGVANLAVACARLGLRTGLAAAFGEDFYGDYCRQTLGVQEGVDLTYSRYITGSHSPVTVSMAYERDRAMVTHAHASDALRHLIGPPPRTRACSVDLHHDRPLWVDNIAGTGGRVFADIGWDPDERWSTDRLRARLFGCDVFTPNAIEAMHYTHTDSPENALLQLRKHVSLPVVTCGADGAIAFDTAADRVVSTPGVPVTCLDATGAGDVFLAGLMVGVLGAWPLDHALRFGALCGALSVQHFGGALAAPGWGDLANWWRAARTGDSKFADDYAFLEDVLPAHPVPEVSRAIATIGYRAPH